MTRSSLWSGLRAAIDLGFARWDLSHLHASRPAAVGRRPEDVEVEDSEEVMVRWGLPEALRVAWTDSTAARSQTSPRDEIPWWSC
ncbi:MAG: hypothetical protein M3N52_13435 [Actinomycetota bacterium]|nr:hypothetical protein [Actinomycetota bacterium]